MYVIWWLFILGFVNFTVLSIVVPTYSLFVIAVIIMLIIGGILFPVFAIITIAALFIWSFYELGVYIDELLNEKENDLGVELENVLTWIDIKVSGNQDLVD